MKKLIRKIINWAIVGDVYLRRNIEYIEEIDSLKKSDYAIRSIKEIINEQLEIKIIIGGRCSDDRIIFKYKGREFEPELYISNYFNIEVLRRSIESFLIEIGI